MEKLKQANAYCHDDFGRAACKQAVQTAPSFENWPIWQKHCNSGCKEIKSVNQMTEISMMIKTGMITRIEMSPHSVGTTHKKIGTRMLPCMHCDTTEDKSLKKKKKVLKLCQCC